MTEFILGPAGSGKTTLLVSRILDDLSAGKRVILLVPEQAAVKVESMVTAAAQAKGIPQTELEILNFRRLSNRVFREYGGIAYYTVSQGAKALLLWEALFAMAPHLTLYQSEVEDAEQFIPHLLSAIGEFKAYGITASMLENAAHEAREDNSKLADKLSDLSLLYAKYTHLLGETHSDPADDLTRLANILSEHRFFQGISLYLDGFFGFTPQEYRVLFHAFRQADKVTVTFYRKETADLAFESKNKEYRKLLSLSENDTPVLTYLSEPLRFTDPALTFLEEHLWEIGESVTYPGETDAVRTVFASDRYDEAEFVAADICRRLSEGACYRDFAVIAGDINSYRGILDTAMARYGLPCHISRKIELAEKPIFKLILSALAIKNSGWQTEDVIVFLKTGLSGLSVNACDELENYATRWHIVGRRWYDGEEWFMNPDGYTDRLSPDAEVFLSRVNATRKEIIPKLTKLHESLDGTRTILDICRALDTFVVELGVPQQLSLLGNDDEIRLYNRFVEVLDILVDTLGSQKADARLFAGLFGLVVKQTDVGNLPATVDEIAVGSAGLFRSDSVRHVYLLGVNEGVFPAACHENTLFNDNEKSYLETCGILLSPDSVSASVDELFHFYMSVCTAAESLTALSLRTDASGKPLNPSVGFERLCLLFPQNTVLDTRTLPKDYPIRTKQSAFAFLPQLGETPMAEALNRIFRADPDYAAFGEQSRQPLVSTNETLSEETARQLFGDHIALTQSRLDAYVKCAFGYQCQYVLKLKENKRIEFAASDTGTLVHAILEKFFLAISAGNDRLPILNQEEIDRKIDEILTDYLNAVYGTERDKQLTPRALQLFRRLKRTVRLLVRNLLDEFEQSDFVPRFFEMPINNSGEDGTVAPLAIPLPDGTTACIYGIVDRVDICRKDQDVYVRVVDYKTGTKNFSLSDISLGLNLQLLLYLFSLWKDKSGAFRRAIHCEGEILPAGVLYCSAKPSTVAAESEISDAKIYEKISETFSRKGLLLEDEEILRMMEKKLTGKYIPVRLTQKGEFMAVSKKNLKTLAGFGELLESISNIVASLAMEMKQGNASCHPLKKNGHDGCRYCAFKEICRNPAAFVPGKQD